ncbi:unnamed protein product [Allacma fusca]|uniref:Uncharacterized protein n=1 Tax=Allacma fusca TaxID=39272 RepID=A0A8J2LTT8_9HEXA|nr:unnamed protein product [Allacma fusca]
MRLSVTVLICQTIILILLGFAIGMEIPAWLNDFLWNDMKDNPKQRFNLTQLQKCASTLMNGTIVLPTQTDYNGIFLAKKRDLPFESYFLGLVGFSFLLYFISSMIYLSWKRIMPNIYISIIVNFLGSIIHSTAFCLILSSTVMYSEENRNYMGSKVCYKFVCNNCPDEETDAEYYERSKHLYLRTRHCLEKLSVCQSSWLKDRIVYFLLFSIMASLIALASSLARWRRRSRKNQIQPKRFSFDSDDTVEEIRASIRTSVVKSKQNVVTAPPPPNITSFKSSSGS